MSVVTHYVLDARSCTPHFPGIGRYILNLTRALIPQLAHGECVTVLYDPRYPLSLPASESVSLYPVSASPFSAKQQWVVPRLLRNLRADVYHSSYYLMPYLSGVPTVLTVYDLIPTLLPGHSTIRARLLFRWAMLAALWAAFRAIVISQATGRDLRERYALSHRKLVIIPLAADPAFRPVPWERVQSIRSQYGLPREYVLYLGSNKPHKNLVRLVLAWGRIQPQRSQLVIAGAWDPRFSEPRQQAADLGLEQMIRFLGPVPERDVPALYGGAKLFVFPSEYEGFGLPVLEAMACGTPVACSNVSSLPEVAGDAAVYFDPTDVDAIAHTLERSLAAPDLLASLGTQGPARASQFSWERTARATLELYRGIRQQIRVLSH